VQFARGIRRFRSRCNASRLALRACLKIPPATAAGLLTGAFVGPTVTARCGGAPVGPPRPQPKSLAVSPAGIFRQALIPFHSQDETNSLGLLAAGHVARRSQRALATLPPRAWPAAKIPARFRLILRVKWNYDSSELEPRRIYGSESVAGPFGPQRAFRTAPSVLVLTLSTMVQGGVCVCGPSFRGQPRRSFNRGGKHPIVWPYSV